MPVDVLAVTETWITPDCSDSEVCIDGYTTLRKDREDSWKEKGGGIIIYVRNGINCTLRSDMLADGSENIWIEINRKKAKPLIVGTFYRPPDEDFEIFLNGLNNSLNLIDVNTVEVALLGDYNVDFSASSKSSMKRRLNSSLLANGFQKNAPWNVIDTAETVDDAVSLWEQLFCSIADCHAITQLKGNSTPWVTEKLIEIRRDRDFHFRKARSTNNSKYHWDMYKKLRNYANREERRLKSNYFCNLIHESKSDSSKMWKSIKKALPTKSAHQIPTLVSKRKVFSGVKDVVNIFNVHFSTVGQKLSQIFGRPVKFALPEIAISTKFELKEITQAFVCDQLTCLKPNKAIGLDKISARLLKDASEIITPILTKIINMSISQNSFPNNWKSAKVVALFKDGDRNDCNNYRPISVLPTVSKILERAVYSQLYTYLAENKLLFVRQFGFQRRRSTSSALLQFTDDLLRTMDNGKVTGVIYLDLKKAFDTVNHTILCQKLKWLGVHSSSLQWFQSYLCHRTQRTVIGDFQSDLRKVTVGVPQGSVLGPLLFLAYINDLPLCLNHAQASLFADDTAIYCEASSPTDLQNKLNSDLSHLTTWLHANRLTLNIKKSKFMIVGGSQRLKSFATISLSISGCDLVRESCYKYLGIVINETLNWSDHVDYLHKKMAKRLGMFKRLKHLLPLYSRKLVVNSLMLPLLDYGDVVWGDRNNITQMNSLQLIHNNIAKTVLDLPSSESSSKALNFLKWNTLAERRKFHRSYFAFKALNDLIDFNLDNIKGKDIHSYNTRNKNQIRLPKTRTSWGQQTSQYFFIKEWNNLPPTVKDACSFLDFKRKYIKHFLNF